jgi:RNA polymerase sigma-70 factor (ECF subfamily)
LEPQEKPSPVITDPASLERIFKQYYGVVCNTIYHYIRDKSKTEDVAQEMFAELWQKRDHLVIHTSLAAYLRRMAVTRSLNYIRDNHRHQWDELEPVDAGITYGVTNPDVIEHMEEAELKVKIDEAIQHLPEKCRIVFLMSRTEEMSYAEIASALNISLKTVENQIGKALKLLRQHLAEHRG